MIRQSGTSQAAGMLLRCCHNNGCVLWRHVHVGRGGGGADGGRRSLGHLLGGLLRMSLRQQSSIAGRSEPLPPSAGADPAPSRCPLDRAPVDELVDGTAASPSSSAGGSLSPGSPLPLPTGASAIATGLDERQRSASSQNIFLSRLRAEWRIFCQLSKYKLSALVVATTGFGYFMAGGALLSPLLPVTLLGTTLHAAAAGIVNQMMEVKQDSQMSRTRIRPLPTRRISMERASVYAVSCLSAGFGLLLTGTNLTTALLGLGTTVLYTAVYTPLKLHTEWNTSIGAVVGAIPPMMGYTAVAGGGSLLSSDISPWILGGALLFWQLPHFYALAWMCRKDYALAAYKMISVTRPAETGLHTFLSSLWLFPLCAAASAYGVTDPWFFATSSIVNGWLSYDAWRFYKSDSSKADDTARKVFRTSLYHLPLLLALLVLHRRRRETDAQPESRPSLSTLS